LLAVTPLLRRFADFGALDLVFFLMNTLRRLAAIHQDRIVHSGPLATPCRTEGRSYNPAYVFGFPKRIDRMTAPVAIIMGSQSDWETMRHAAETLTALGVACEKHIVSAHRTPDRLFAFAKGAKAAGFQIIIAGAGGAAHLPGMAASLTELPVFGVPIESKALSGVDSLYSIVQMPAGVPVGTLAIGKPGAINAALLAASVLALNDATLAGRLVAWRTQQTEAVAERPEGSA
jgi:5-(carboxyamino)imidazole ribonucleotide mutase